jgi:hypothetical protein
LLAATLYKRSPDRNQRLWNIISTERYILQMQVKLEHLEDVIYLADFR